MTIRGTALATKAAHAMLRCGFEEHGFERIFAGADPPNAASFWVMARLGMRFDRRLDFDGMPADYHVIERADFQPGEADYEVLRV